MRKKRSASGASALARRYCSIMGVVRISRRRPAEGAERGAGFGAGGRATADGARSSAELPAAVAAAARGAVSNSDGCVDSLAMADRDSSPRMAAPAQPEYAGKILAIGGRT